MNDLEPGIPVQMMDGIQPHGVLFACRRDDLSVVLVSSNLRDWFGLSPERVIGRPLTDVLQVGDTLQLVQPESPREFPIQAGDLRRFDAVAHLSGDTLIVEVEPTHGAEDERPFELDLRASALALHRVSSVRELQDRAARELRRLTGFDRVMVIRPDAAGKPTIAAESKRDDLKSLAAELGCLERLRPGHIPTRAVLVADVEYRPVPLEPRAGSVAASSVDLRGAALHGAAPDELEFLKKLGVTASMSLPLVADGIALGCIVCHHHGGPRRVRLARLHAVEHLVHTLAWQFRALDRAERAETALAEAKGARAAVADPLTDEFITTLSHELRNPLNVVAGWTALLKSGVLSDEERARAIDVIDRNVGLQRRLVDDLLDASQAARAKLVLDGASVDLNHLVDDCVNSCLPAAEAKSLVIQRFLAPDVPSIRADADRLRQVVGNLVTNAIKFTPKGGWIRVQTRGGDSHVEVDIADNGPGISESLLPHIFEPFRQGGRAGKTAPGLGLGLTIAKQLVELHGGSLVAESPGPGLGSTFRMRLPLAPGG